MIADGKKIKKIECPHCGHKQNIFTKQEPIAEGSFLSAKIQIAERNLK